MSELASQLPAASLFPAATVIEGVTDPPLLRPAYQTSNGTKPSETFTGGTGRVEDASGSADFTATVDGGSAELTS